MKGYKPRLRDPILIPPLIAWRRPHTLRQVIDAIRPVAPTRLYVACSGPNLSAPAKPRRWRHHPKSDGIMRSLGATPNAITQLARIVGADL